MEDCEVIEPTYIDNFFNYPYEQQRKLLDDRLELDRKLCEITYFNPEYFRNDYLYVIKYCRREFQYLQAIREDALVSKSTGDWFRTKLSSVALFLLEFRKYDERVFCHWAKHFHDTMLYFLYDSIIKQPGRKGFPLNRSFLTPHRRRILASTMNAEPVIFTNGINFNHALGVGYCPKSTSVEVFTKLDVPPVLLMKTCETHTVFLCHNGELWGCGKKKFLVVGEINDEVYVEEVQKLDFWLHDTNPIIDFFIFTCGTFLITKKRWYFVGDHHRIREVEMNPNAVFEPVFPFLEPEETNYWVCQEIPPGQGLLHPSVLTCDVDQPITFFGQKIRVKVFPQYWIELNTPFDRRPVCYMLDGIEMKNMHIQHFTGAWSWVIIDHILYSARLELMMINSEGNHQDLDNYMMLVELTENRTPTPFVVTTVISTLDTLFIQCGDIPIYAKDHIKYLEERNRGNVHNYIFDMFHEYYNQSKTPEEREDDKRKQYLYNQSIVEHWTCYSDRERRIVEKNKKEKSVALFKYKLEPLVRKLIAEAEDLINLPNFKQPLKMDDIAYLLPEYRYANYMGLLYYMSLPRLPGRPPKYMDTDLDVMVFDALPDRRAIARMKLLIEEFERVNYPGTMVWKPHQWLNEYKDQLEVDEEEILSDEEYQMEAATWCYEMFLETLKSDWESQKKDPTKLFDFIDFEIATQLLFLVRFIREMICHTNGQKYRLDLQKTIYARYENRVQINQQIFSTSNPMRLLFDRSKKLIISKKLYSDRTANFHYVVELKFDYTHDDPTILASNFAARTSRMFLANTNATLLDHIDDKGLIDLNSIYPDDPELHRLIVQTHFHGHGLTEMEPAIRHKAALYKLGWTIRIVQDFMKGGKRHRLGYLVTSDDQVEIDKDLYLLDLKPDDPMAYKLETTDPKDPIYCHRVLIDTFSMNRAGVYPPLSRELLTLALNGLYDRRVFTPMSMSGKMEIVNWYFKSDMPEAFQDLMKQCIMDANSNDYKYIRELVTKHEFLALRFIAEYRPGIILWNRSPLPEKSPRIMHLILSMWPKNEYGRTTRVPQPKMLHQGHVVDSAFHLLSYTDQRNHFATFYPERMGCKLEFEEDFPLDESEKPFEVCDDEIESLPAEEQAQAQEKPQDEPEGQDTPKQNEARIKAAIQARIAALQAESALQAQLQDEISSQNAVMSIMNNRACEEASAIAKAFVLYQEQMQAQAMNQVTLPLPQLQTQPQPQLQLPNEFLAQAVAQIQAQDQAKAQAEAQLNDPSLEPGQGQGQGELTQATWSLAQLQSQAQALSQALNNVKLQAIAQIQAQAPPETIANTQAHVVALAQALANVQVQALKDHGQIPLQPPPQPLTQPLTQAEVFAQALAHVQAQVQAENQDPEMIQVPLFLPFQPQPQPLPQPQPEPQAQPQAPLQAQAQESLPSEEPQDQAQAQPEPEPAPLTRPVLSPHIRARIYAHLQASTQRENGVYAPDASQRKKQRPKNCFTIEELAAMGVEPSQFMKDFADILYADSPLSQLISKEEFTKLMPKKDLLFRTIGKTIIPVPPEESDDDEDVKRDPRYKAIQEMVVRRDLERSAASFREKLAKAEATARAAAEAKAAGQSSSTSADNGNVRK